MCGKYCRRDVLTKQFAVIIAVLPHSPIGLRVSFVERF